MAPKFALFTKGSKLPLNKGFKKYVWVTIVLRSTLEMIFMISWIYDAVFYSIYPKNFRAIIVRR